MWKDGIYIKAGGNNKFLCQEFVADFLWTNVITGHEL